MTTAKENDSSYPLVIVGSGMAAYALIKEIRKFDQAMRILVVTSEEGRAYSKPLLSTGFSRNKTAEELCSDSHEDMQVKFNIHIEAHTDVTRIDTECKIISTASGKQFNYEKLVLATGASPYIPPIPGIQQSYQINNLKDYETFRTQLNGKKRIAIIGAGLVGCEFTHDLNASNHDITLIDIADTPLQRLLPLTCSDLLYQHFQKMNVSMQLGKVVTQIQKEGEMFSIALAEKDKMPTDANANSGATNALSSNTTSPTSCVKTIDVDLVISAVGLTPNVRLGSEANLRIDNGICVDSRLQTSNEHIYAIGDCANIAGTRYAYVMPLLASAKALSQTLLGRPTDVLFPTMPIVVKTPTLPIVVCLPDSGTDGRWHIARDSSGISAQFVDEQGRLSGFCLMGEHAKERQRYTKALTQRTELQRIEHA